MAVSTGTFTVGPDILDDYATWEAALADIINGSLTGVLVFTQTGPTIETGVASLPANFVTGPIHQLVLNSNLQHRGCTLTKSHLTEIAHSGDGLDLTCNAAVGDVRMNVNNLYLKRTIAGATVQTALIKQDVPTALFGGSATNYTQLLLDGNNLQGTGFKFDILAGGMNPNVNLGSSLIFNCNNSGVEWLFQGIADQQKLQSITVSDCDVGFALTSPGPAIGSVQSCGSFFSISADFQGHGDVVGTGNASSDLTATDANWGTGTLNVPSITPATEYITVSRFNPEYYRIKPTSQLRGLLATILTGTRDITFDRLLISTIWNLPTELFVDEVAVGAHAFGSFLKDQIEAEEAVISASLVSSVTAANIVELSQDPQVLRTIPATVLHTVEMSQQQSVKQTAVLTVQSDVEFIQGISIIGDAPCVLDTTTERSTVNLWFPIDTLANQLVLPRPQFGDNYGLDTRVTPRNVRGGDLRVYKAGRVITRLLMPFGIDRPKRDECISFFDISSSQEIILLDWENRRWRGVIINTPIDFTSQGRTGQSETFAFDLEFEATERLN